MTRLFLRFYLGVITILFGAGVILGAIVNKRTSEQNIRVVERALAGGARLAKQKIVQAEPSEIPQVLDAIRSDFAYPVRLIRIGRRDFDPNRLRRLRDGEVVLHGNRVSIALPDRDRALAFGPLPQFVQPSPAEVMTGLGAIFVLAALAIAFLLRPVVVQLRAVERTATAIAEGNLSARIDATKANRRLKLADAFNTMAERTETLLRSQRELLQAVSHELRTPLSRIRFAIDLIETSGSAQQQRERLDSVDTALQELDDLVGELLTYVRLESKEAAADAEVIDVSELCEEQVEIHAPLHPTVNFDVVRPARAVCVSGDRSSLSRAVGNLLSNAGRFASRQVTIGTSQRESQITIDIDDDGPGIPEADRSKIFDPFVRLGHCRGRGAGLGLALVHRIATRHGGHVQASSSPDGGARLRLVLPAAPHG